MADEQAREQQQQQQGSPQGNFIILHSKYLTWAFDGQLFHEISVKSPFHDRRHAAVLEPVPVDDSAQYVRTNLAEDENEHEEEEEVACKKDSGSDSEDSEFPFDIRELLLQTILPVPGSSEFLLVCHTDGHDYFVSPKIDLPSKTLVLSLLPWPTRRTLPLGALPFSTKPGLLYGISKNGIERLHPKTEIEADFPSMLSAFRLHDEENQAKEQQTKNSGWDPLCCIPLVVIDTHVMGFTDIRQAWLLIDANELSQELKTDVSTMFIDCGLDPSWEIHQVEHVRGRDSTFHILVFVFAKQNADIEDADAEEGDESSYCAKCYCFEEKTWFGDTLDLGACDKVQMLTFKDKFWFWRELETLEEYQVAFPQGLSLVAEHLVPKKFASVDEGEQPGSSKSEFAFDLCHWDMFTV